jgi:tRNA(Ile)-lysidine synthetase-like protein
LAKSGLKLRNWHAGDRYQPAHTAAPRKLKELLQSPHIPRAQKPFWPVVVSGEEIVWVPGFASPLAFHAKDPALPALLLEEVLLGSEAKKGP